MFFSELKSRCGTSITLQLFCVKMCEHINLLSLADMLPPPPSLSLSLSLHADVFSPLAIFIPHISYHSATVRWATAHINVSFNHTYYITYSIFSSTLTSNKSVMAARVQHTAIGDVYSVNLSSLLPNATYVSTIVSASEIYGEMRFSGPTISTLPYRKLSDILHIPFGLSLPLLAFISHCH